MSGYPNPGGGGGGSVGTLAQVLAKGADANGVEITDAHDPTAAQSLATQAYVLANVIGVPLVTFWLALRPLKLGANRRDMHEVLSKALFVR